MKLTLAEILSKTSSVPFAQTDDMSFVSVAPLDRAQREHISFLSNEKYLEEAFQSQAGAIFCTQKDAAILSQKNTISLLLVCADPYAAFAKVSQSFFKPSHPFSGISPQAIIDQSAVVHGSATIFPFVFVGPGAHIGANSVVYSGCFIGAASTVGDDCILYPNVVIREGCRIGDRCLLNPGAVIGGDGFGFAPTEKENVKIPQIGTVQIAEDVEIGANTTIDRGALGDTKIGRQTKIDNLVMIAHNVQVGEFCFLAGQVGIAGSTKVGDRVLMGGQVGVAGHLKIGDKVKLSAQTGVSKDIPEGQICFGTPARPQKEAAIGVAVMNQLIRERMKKS